MLISIKSSALSLHKMEIRSSKPTLKINDIVVFENNFRCIPSKKNVICNVYGKVTTIIQFICQLLS